MTITIPDLFVVIVFVVCLIGMYPGIKAGAIELWEDMKF